jgi:hypothetical protein
VAGGLYRIRRQADCAEDFSIHGEELGLGAEKLTLD